MALIWKCCCMPRGGIRRHFPVRRSRRASSRAFVVARGLSLWRRGRAQATRTPQMRGCHAGASSCHRGGDKGWRDKLVCTALGDAWAPEGSFKNNRGTLKDNYLVRYLRRRPWINPKTYISCHSVEDHSQSAAMKSSRRSLDRRPEHPPNLLEKYSTEHCLRHVHVSVTQLGQHVANIVRLGHHLAKLDKIGFSSATC